MRLFGKIKDEEINMDRRVVHWKDVADALKDTDKIVKGKGYSSARYKVEIDQDGGGEIWFRADIDMVFGDPCLSIRNTDPQCAISTVYAFIDALPKYDGNKR